MQQACHIVLKIICIRKDNAFMNKKISIASFIKNTISYLYLIILVYNLIVANFIAAAISLLLFVLSCPIFFPNIKSKHLGWIKIINNTAAICTIIILSFTIVTTIAGFKNGTTDTIPTAEQQYIDTVLSQITAESSKEDVIILLGKPDRDLVAKVNWWVNIEGANSRVGVYFSITSGKATEIVLDGGVGRFYYQEKLE